MFQLFERFVEDGFGEDAFDDLVEGCDLETTEPFLGPGNYPAADLVALVVAASETTGIPVEDLLRRFGRFAFPHLAGTIPTLLAGLDTPRGFLANLESVIHTEVRKLDPDASPARFSATERPDGSLTLTYESPLGLFALVEGFLDGVGDWYRSPVAHTREQVDGTNATFHVHFDGAGPAPEPTIADAHV
ncbi:MAG: heme NO-binding domain-containing protein [Actinomycetota bacterium]